MNNRELENHKSSESAIFDDMVQAKGAIVHSPSEANRYVNAIHGL